MDATAPIIVPRWEWRSFDGRFPVAEPLFDELERTGVHESEEMYLVSHAGGANVKIRDGLMDIKILQEVDAEGLERWTPVMKREFPLSKSDIGKVFDALEIEMPRLERDSYDFTTFMSELIEPPAVRPVTVHKHRVRYLVNGCTSEVTDVVVDGRACRTIAVESEDAAAILEGVRSMGLDGYVNTNYTEGLIAILEEEPARYGVIDVGTNSVKFHLAERSSSGGWTTLVDRADVTRLGEGMDATGAISHEPLERTATAIAAMAREALSNGAKAVVAVGTAGMRSASNSEQAVQQIRERSGVTVDVISGTDESRLAYLAAVAGLGLGNESVVVFDTGGGSSQFTFGTGPEVDERFSVNVGAVRFTEQFGLDCEVTQETLEATFGAISDDLGELDGHTSPKSLVAMGGAITNMTAVKHALATYDPEVVHGTVLDRSEIDRQIQMYRSMDADHRRSIVGLQPARAEVILAGACIVRTVMEKLGMDSATVCDRGLRHGVLSERFGT
ncbi:MAG TPA: Ppx/GppA family phosphatase [Acidimicrobiia bacterium]|nr:Ppx/GppA family phosphatase [Acidimicrobiia bacterium]